MSSSAGDPGNNEVFGVQCTAMPQPMDSHSVQCEAKAVAQDLRTVSGGLDIDRYEDILIYRDTQKVDNIFVSLDFTILPKTCFLVQPAPCKTISIKVYHTMGAEYDLLHALCYSLFEARNVKKCARPPTTLGV